MKWIRTWLYNNRIELLKYFEYSLLSSALQQNSQTSLCRTRLVHSCEAVIIHTNDLLRGCDPMGTHLHNHQRPPPCKLSVWQVISRRISTAKSQIYGKSFIKNATQCPSSAAVVLLRAHLASQFLHIYRKKIYIQKTMPSRTFKKN